MSTINFANSVNGLSFIALDEYTNPEAYTWICGNEECTPNYYEYWRGPRLDYDGECWTCPVCGCSTSNPQEDGCYSYTLDEDFESLQDDADFYSEQMRFYKLEVVSGYYSGVQVRAVYKNASRWGGSHWLTDGDNPITQCDEFTLDYDFDYEFTDAETLKRDFDQDTEFVKGSLAALAGDYGIKFYRLCAVASNGNGFYSEEAGI